MPFRSEALELATSTLREAQVGALHAIAAHGSITNEPSQLILPTGVGKTLVAVLAPYMLNADRVLVVTPARIVRDQVAYEFRNLVQAFEQKALMNGTPRPAVARADHRCSSETWDEYREVEVVVGTPMVLSHGYEGVDPVPLDLFDLVIFDEAHHLPARTWTDLHERLSDVRSILLTATPFRNDRQRLPGDIAYAYPLKRAVARGVYSPVSYVRVDPPADPADRDAALAAEAIRRLRAPAHQQAMSCLLVRTNSKDHADALVELYGASGAAVAKVVDSTSGATVRRYLKRLDEADGPGRLDGLVVVGAMTEGFDFPRLKIAAYHHAHSTLGPTLQFIGRLARAGDIRGELVAFPDEVSGETAHLYREDAVWEEMLPAMVDASVEQEQQVRRFATALRTFEPSVHRVPALSITPPRMTHVYRLQRQPTLDWDPARIGGGDVIERYQHPESQLLAFITRHSLHPRFIKGEILDSHEHLLHVATWVEDPGVLFVSTESSSALKAIREGVAQKDSTPVDAVDLTKLLYAANLERCFSVGTRPNTLGGATNESYRMSAGPNAQQTITPGDARAYVLGHVMGRKGGAGAGSGTYGFSAGKAKI